MTASPPAPIVLIGFMGSGKSSVGRELGRRLGVRFVDADAAVERTAGRPISAIFEADGEAAFRALEHAAIADLLGQARPGVIALGGGAPMHPQTHELLDDARRAGRARVVHLRIRLDRALARVGGDPARPMLNHPDLPDLHARRLAVYDALAELIVDVDELSVSGTADRVLDHVRRRHPDQPQPATPA